MIEATRWLYDPKNKEEALSIHMKVVKGGRESAEEDYKYLVQDFQPFPRHGTISKVSYDKTMELRAKEGLYQGKKVPPMSEYVESSLIDEALNKLESSCAPSKGDCIHGSAGRPAMAGEGDHHPGPAAARDHLDCPLSRGD
ncbi:MAG TPA: hypothetical protein VHM64_24825 [Candidatus Binatia bacterium]|nr:hypothetical protein [Candidatus Binatia bacterium]